MNPPNTPSPLFPSKNPATGNQPGQPDAPSMAQDAALISKSTRPLSADDSASVIRKKATALAAAVGFRGFTAQIKSTLGEQIAALKQD
jgi:hypothetical protein